jgi:hypothetical protein
MTFSVPSFPIPLVQLTRNFMLRRANYGIQRSREDTTMRHPTESVLNILIERFTKEIGNRLEDVNPASKLRNQIVR